jgi:hypothetical protein
MSSIQSLIRSILLTSAVIGVASVKASPGVQKSNKKLETNTEQNENKTAETGSTAAAPSSSAISDFSGPKLDISGFTVIAAAATSSNNRDNGVGNPGTYVGIGASNLFFTVSGKPSKQILDEYKWTVVFDAYPGASKYVNQNYVEFISNKYGSVHFGNVTGLEDRMLNDSNTRIQGFNGKDGGIWSLVNSAEGVNNDIMMNITTQKCLKISYYTPRVLGGLQIGITYTPKTDNMGRADQNGLVYNKDDNTGNNAGIYADKDNRPNGVHNVALGLNFARSFYDWYFELSAIGMLEKSRFPYQYQDYYKLYQGKAYQLGAVVKYKEWELAGGYMNNLRSRLFKEAPAATVGNNPANTDPCDLYRQEGPDANKGNSGTAWNVGGTWRKDAWTLALVYNRMDRRTDATNKSKANLYTAAVDWAFTRGLVLFCELDYLQSSTSDAYKTIRQGYYDSVAKGKKAIGKASNVAVIIGTKVRF